LDEVAGFFVFICFSGGEALNMRPSIAAGTAAHHRPPPHTESGAAARHAS
jgi:hypothetical protein